MPLEPSNLRRSLLVAIVIALAFGSWAAADWYRAEEPKALQQAKYVGRQSCIECHQTQAAAFNGSDHDRAMELANDSTVLGDFDDAEFERLGEKTRFFRDGEKFMVNAEGPDGEYHDYEIWRTFGIRPLQQYMVKFPDGRVQVLRVSWDVKKKKWFYVGPPDAEDERLEPTDPLHWTGLAQNWNTMCAECHSTDYHKNFNLEKNSYHSTFKEIDVSCEACHGPGSLHVDLAQSRSLFWDRKVGYGLTNTLKNASNARQMETCAPCHSRRSVIHANYRAGDPMYDNFDPVLLFSGLYHADGQIEDEVYEFGSFTQSKMYQKGVRCSDCHDPHSLELKFEGNRLCAQCHQPGKYDGAGHHHHPDAAAGAAETQCVSCHMPSKTYMGIDDRRDHSIRVPRPDLTVELQTPNACNRCHTKPTEDATWAAENVVKWYGPKRPDDPHYAHALAAGRKAAPEGERLIRELLRRDAVPSIVRATAISLLGGYPTPSSERLRRQALEDPDPAVRAAAIHSLTTDTGARLLRFTAPLLRDPVLSVRIAAASRLVANAPDFANTPFQSELDRAIEEFREGQSLHYDRADSHMSLGSLSEQLKDIPAAINSFREAIRVEPYRSGPRRELARLLEQVANDPTLAEVREAIRPDPQEIERLRREEADLLARDAKLLPGNPTPLYDRAMLLYLLGDLDTARESLEAACRVSADYYAAWMALALICEKQERWDDARRAILKMRDLQPEAADWQGVGRRIIDTMRAQQAEQAANAPHSESLSPEEATDPATPDGQP